MKLIFLLFLSTLLLVGCATDSILQYKGTSAGYIYAKGHNYLAEGDYNDAITAFETINSDYPFSEYSQKANLEIMYAYYLADQPAMVLASAGRYIKLYPQSKNLDYAYYMTGIVEFNNGRGFLQRYFPYDMSEHYAKNYQNAYDNFNMVVTLYPKSPYAKDSRRRMIFLINTMAQYEYNIADYYFRRGAYAAVIDRDNDVLLHFPNSPVALDALKLNIAAFEKLGLEGAVEVNKKVLQANEQKK